MFYIKFSIKYTTLWTTNVPPMVRKTYAPLFNMHINVYMFIFFCYFIKIVTWWRIEFPLFIECENYNDLIMCMRISFWPI